MSRRIEFYIDKLEWLGPQLVRGLGLLSSAETVEQTFSFSQVMVLQTLFRAREMRMTELANFLGLSKANATGLIDRLVARGLVRRQRSEADRRVVHASLTPEGRRTAEQLVAASRAGLRQLMKRVPEQNLGPFIDTLERLALGLAENQPAPADPKLQSRR